jgi:hypothetical protein
MVRIGYLSKLNKKVEKMLKGLYDDCDSKGHISPDQASNTCNYCFRTLNYQTPEANKILESRKNLPLDQQPYDASEIKKLMDEEISHQKTKDYFRGWNILYRKLNREKIDKNNLLNKLD